MPTPDQPDDTPPPARRPRPIPIPVRLHGLGLVASAWTLPGHAGCPAIEVRLHLGPKPVYTIHCGLEVWWRGLRRGQSKPGGWHLDEDVSRTRRSRFTEAELVDELRRAIESVYGEQERTDGGGRHW